ncbi:MAG: transcription elongation factor GreA [Bacilli bacterium]
MTERLKITKAGYQKLQDELRTLIDVTRDEVKSQLAEARAQGDLSENADYDAARNKQAEVEARIKQIEDILETAEIIEEVKHTNRVALGSTVTIKIAGSEDEQRYKILGTIESDPFSGIISNICPLGEAIIGKSLGDVVEVKGTKPYKIEIVKIESSENTKESK